MWGTIVGDMAGAPFEGGRPIKPGTALLTQGARFTDDTVLMVAYAKALADGQRDLGLAYRQAFARYPKAGFGGMFRRWAVDPSVEYSSYGNGSAMRVAPAAWVSKTLKETLEEARRSAMPTHSHPEGVRGAQAIAGATFMARDGANKAQIKDWVQSLGYDLSQDDPRAWTRRWFATCQATVPNAVRAFLQADGFEQAVDLGRRAGADADTIAAMSGAIAEAFWGVPQPLRAQASEHLDDWCRETMDGFEARWPQVRAA